MKNKILFICLIVLLFLSGCDVEPSARRNTITTKKQVDAEVVNVDQTYWYASGTHYQLIIDLEYNGLDTTVEYDGADARRYWDQIKEGDIMTVYLFTTMYEDDGSIIRQYIDK